MLRIVDSTGEPRRGLFSYFPNMTKFFLWMILLVLCWPLALLAVVVYPIVWLVLLPFRLVGLAVGGVLSFLEAIVMLPARALGGR